MDCRIETMMEQLMCIKRAGASLISTYFAKETATFKQIKLKLSFYKNFKLINFEFKHFKS
jgi:hypothetical protein